MEHPIDIFKAWWKEEKVKSRLTIPSACCLSTIGLDGYPNARFLALKQVIDGMFIISGPLNARKGKEVGQNGRVALTFWWTATERQVRIQGDALPQFDTKADQLFEKRNQASKIVSTYSQQGETIEDLAAWNQFMHEQLQSAKKEEIPRPEHWGLIAIHPIRIEFLEFQQTRLHQRRLFEQKNESWEQSYLQP